MVVIQFSVMSLSSTLGAGVTIFTAGTQQKHEGREGNFLLEMVAVEGLRMR